LALAARRRWRVVQLEDLRGELMRARHRVGKLLLRSS
jgi:hypothetical protein